MKHFLEGFNFHATMISQDIFEKFKQFENLKNSLGEIKVVQLKKYFNYCQLTQNYDELSWANLH